MSSFKIFDIAGAGMSAQSVRVNTVASNLANADSVSGDPNSVYRATHPVFQAVMGSPGDLSAAKVNVTGTVAAICIQTPMDVMKRAVNLHPWVFRPPVHQPVLIARKIVDWSNISRRQGLLGLEHLIEAEPDAFLRKGLQLVVDGSEPDTIRSTLEVDMYGRDAADTPSCNRPMARRKRHEEPENHEAWAIPYGDLVTLLLAFFVVMYAMSSVNEGKYRVLSDSLNEAFNGTPRSAAAVSVVEDPPRKIELPLNQVHRLITAALPADGPDTTRSQLQARRAAAARMLPQVPN